MSTTTVTVTPAPHVTFLQHIGNFFRGIFTEIEKIALAAEPVVDVAFPGIGLLYNSTVQAVSVAEAAGETAAGATSGNGAAKLAAVTSAIEPLAIAYLKAQGITADSTHITAWVNAVVETLNALPAPASAAPAKPTAE